jgi:hypothetical protein
MLLSLVAAVLLAAESPSATLAADLDGGGTPETVTAAKRGKRVRLEVLDARGQRLARAEAPSPGSGLSRITLDTGSLGSAGALVQVVAVSSSGDLECRSLWRYRDGTLSRAPVIGAAGPLPDCGKAGDWTYGWERSQPDAPAVYVREQTRATPDGAFHQKQIYRYAGFRVEFDADHSAAEIGGVTIPTWSTATFYPRPALEGLGKRFDLSALRKAPRLRFETNRQKGVFAAMLERSGSSQRLLVTAAAAGQEKNEMDLTITSGEKTGQAIVRLGSDRSTPLEVLVRGFGEDLAPAFAPVTRFTGSSLEVYETAEQELAVGGLLGTWDAPNGERLEIALVSPSPTVVRVGGSEFVLNIESAPSGADALLVPRKGSTPTLALSLRGPDAFTRVKVSCTTASPGTPPTCRSEGASQVFHRLGSSMAVH